MASHQVAIAKASLAAGLLRPDPTSVSRDEITALHNYLDRALSHCSPANIQTCKNWLLDYVVPSSNRVSLLAKYLVALSGSFGEEDKDGANTTTQGNSRERGIGPSAKRRRLHILYLVNDLFHHTKYHSSSSAAFVTLSGSLQPHIVEILSYAASYDREKNPKLHRRLAELLDIWQEHGYFSADYVGKLREVVTNSAVSGPVRTSTTPGADTGESERKIPRDAPFVMPSTHGDPSTPYYDLPAGNFIPHIIPNSTVPLRPDMVKPLQFLAGPADEKLVTALKVFFKDVDRIYGSGEPDRTDGEVVDIDELGQTVIRDVTMGEILEGETYYGWSRAFCQQMKKRNAGGRSPRRTESHSRSPPKRRRYSDSSNGSRHRSSSRSRTPPHRGRRYDSRSPSRSRSYRRSPSREKSYSPPPPPSQHRQPQHQAQHAPPPPPQHSSYSAPTGYPPQPPPIPLPVPPGGNGFPPPPPTPNYQGPWPPPPPPMGNMGNFSNFPPPFPQQMPPQMPPGSYNFPPPGRHGWHPPPPPPGGRGWR
ncbi:hypothetical protein BJY01DRAFT_213664 [Aspergillus pseudoustus]|uniref:CID domain-containing protein n=1 Tax=Aspergillus pseudoustus TaxID=1810923 RepID=A0ABR4K4G7_9EURO